MKEIFVFGAGASFASGSTPLGKDLVWSYYEDSSLLYEIEQGKPARNDLKERNITYDNYGKFLRLAKDVFPELNEYEKWQNSMNNAMTYHSPATNNKEYYVDEMLRRLQEREDKEGVELVRKLIAEHIGGTSFKSQNLLYQEFVKQLDKRSPEDVIIISFNFDCLLQEDWANGIYFNYLIDFDEIDKHRGAYNKENSIPLIKLNGSLDWAICPECKKINLLYPHIIQKSYNNLCCKMSKDCQGRLRPLISLPHEEKDKLTNVLWGKAKRALKGASKVTVIGYSFPDYDKDIINLFREYTSPDVILEIVDNEDNIGKRDDKETRIRKWLKSIFLSKRDMTISLDGFQGYME